MILGDISSLEVAYQNTKGPPYKDYLRSYDEDDIAYHWSSDRVLFSQNERYLDEDQYTMAQDKNDSDEVEDNPGADSYVQRMGSPLKRNEVLNNSIGFLIRPVFNIDTLK